MKKLLSQIDARDVARILALCLLTAGGYEIYAPLGFIVPGVLIVAADVFGLPQ
jgi:hypothetical protein